MADGVIVQIQGLKELEQQMISLGPRIARTALKGALTAGAAVIKKEAQLLAPSLSGRLRRAMYIKKMGKPNPFKEVVIFGVRHGKKMSKRDLDAWYWGFLEFGTRSRIRRKSKGSTGLVKGLHFVQMAFKNKQTEVLEKIKDVLAKKITSLVKAKI